VSACDEAVRIGGPEPRDSYLRWERILAAAQATGAQAVHPGYGFLSENDEFAQACADAGLVFIGPPPAAIRAMGLKAASKQLMEQAGVPLVPGYHGADQDPALLRREADRIGYPVLIKASAGGGGKGMRAVAAPEEFDAALASCKREAANSFGDDAVLVERYVQRPRHIEIQVFFDTHGNGLYLFERDCSVQRRHQKVLEEAPAPGMAPERRREMGAAAVAAARAVDYVGAGTVEFICEQDGRFYFMEMNTRLQVEHPVTEAITGFDLVEWQLRVAAGEKLPASQETLVLRGHAIEARLCAENPEANFLPATGTLAVLRWPEHVEFQRNADGERVHVPATVRVDTGVVEGDAISPFYDSMIAKVIVWGEDRAQALARLDAALAQTHIVGVVNNVAFLRRVLATRSFSEPVLDTALIERERAHLFGDPGLPFEDVAAGVAAATLAAQRASAGRDPDPWSRRDGWRLHGAAVQRFDLEWGGEPREVRLTLRHGGAMSLAYDGYSGEIAFATQPSNDLALSGIETQSAVGANGAGDVSGHGVHDIVLGTGDASRRLRLTTYIAGEQVTLFGLHGSAQVQVVDPLAHAGEGPAEAGRLTAPMPGKVIAYLVQPGARVKTGQPLAVLEAMKMEHTIAAPRDGTVAELLFAPGDQVSEGGELLTLK
jgi:3-methylcrotonyl-CoA carboxylase alpha subunit